jgi:serine O-acetyltransferase
MAGYQSNTNMVKIDSPVPINKASVLEIVNKLQFLVFPGYFSTINLKSDTVEYYTGSLLEELAHHLEKQIFRAFYLYGGNEDGLQERSEKIALEFLQRVPAVQSLLSTDVDAFYDGDPAAYNTDEIILSYPGLYALMVNRLAHELYILGVPTIPRMMTEHAHSLTGIDINPGAVIGHHFFMDHGTGIVVGETTIIGNYVKVYQGVTLGALSTRGGQQLRGKKRHPTIEDNVTIYSGASILGGDTIIGKNVTIGSNAFIVKSVPEQTKVSIRSPELSIVSNESKHTQDADGNWYYMI